MQAQPKIALRARNIGVLTRASDEAAAAGLPHALVDTGDGGPMVLGIGPASRAELPKFVSKMQLLPHDRTDGQLPAGQPLPEKDAMWILVRRDLGMGRGKLVAQSGHGCWSAGTAALRADPGRVARWKGGGCQVGVLWLDGLDIMRDAHDAAFRSALPSAFIVDAGRTEFDGPTPTVVGIGPCRFDELPEVVQALADVTQGPRP